jgi:ferric-dicitrate binding protein FerR (iron transport regulator)
MSKIEKDIEKIVASYKAPFNKTKEQVWSDIIESVENIPKINKTRILNKNLLKFAASFIGIIALSWFLISNSYQNIITAKGESKVIVLPDNSEITLNSDSHLSYSKLMWNFNRNIELNGEAYFSVTSGSRFKVVSPIAEVRVLGTEFNIFSRDNFYETKCYSGKVQVLHEHHKVLLTKGKAYSVDKKRNRSNQFSFDSINKKDWRNGEFYFINRNLVYVFKELERQFNVKLVLSQNIKYRIYTGYFSNQSLEDALIGICLPMQLSFKINENTVTVTDENRSLK